MGMRLNPDIERKCLELAGVVRLATLTEKEFQAEVVKVAKRAAWMVYHTHNSRRSEPGFPDLVLIRERLVVAELKVGDGKLTAAQANWLDSFRSAGVETYEWRPEDWGTILDVLAANGGPVSGQ